MGRGDRPTAERGGDQVRRHPARGARGAAGPGERRTARPGAVQPPAGGGGLAAGRRLVGLVGPAPDPGARLPAGERLRGLPRGAARAREPAAAVHRGRAAGVRERGVRRAALRAAEGRRPALPLGAQPQGRQRHPGRLRGRHGHVPRGDRRHDAGRRGAGRRGAALVPLRDRLLPPPAGAVGGRRVAVPDAVRGALVQQPGRQHQRPAHRDGGDSGRPARRTR